MTVSITSKLPVNTESSNKLLNSNSNAVDSGNNSSFNATMSESAAQYNLDNKAYLLADGQVLTPEQLLEMMQYGNNVPLSNLATMPNFSELQQIKLQSQVGNNSASLNLGNASTMASLEMATHSKQNFDFAKDYNFNQQLSQQPLINTIQGSTLLFNSNLNNLQSNIKTGSDPAMLGFSAVSGYQITMGQNGINGYTNSSMNITTPVHSPQWNQSLGQSVQYLVAQNIHHAEIKLNPPDLGMLDIRVVVNDNHANVSFSAASASVRDAIEAALPRLREMLEESGISLNDANVSEHSFNNQQQENSESNEVNSGSPGSDDFTERDNRQNGNVMKVGLLDIYA